MSLGMNKNYLVEFIGLPGAGKSTLAIDVIEQFKKNGFGCHDFDEIFKHNRITNKWLAAMLYFIKNPGFVFYTLLYTIYSSPADLVILKYNIGRLVELLKLIVILDISRSKIQPPSLFVLDQGLIQGIWSITSLGGKVRKDVLKKLMVIKKDIIPDLIIYIDTEPITAVNRISNRNSKCVFDHLISSQCCELFSRQGNNYSDILEVINEVKNPGFLTLDGSGAVNDNVHSIWEFINQNINEG